MTQTQSQILKRLHRILDLAQDIRVGQLVSNLAFLARPESPEPAPNVEDEELLAACDEHLANLERFVDDCNQATCDAQPLVAP